MSKKKSSRGYAVYQDDILDCREYGLKLDEAFHSIMAHCAFEPVWETADGWMALRFRYLEEPYQGHFVGDTEPGPLIVEFSEKINQTAVFIVRDTLMLQAVTAGLRAWYAMSMDLFYIRHGMAEAKQRAGEHQGWPSG